MGIISRQSGQMTVEFMVALPVMMIVAVIAVNAVLFFSECAAFDRIARSSVIVRATSPAYDQDAQLCAVAVENDIKEALREDDDVSVSVEDRSGGLREYAAQLSFEPTLFGMAFNGSVFGVNLPPLQHRIALTVDPYKPGMLL